MSATQHLLRCRCGTLQGEVRHGETANRGVCYCRDCQAYAHSLGQPGEVLDAMGGTQIVAIQPRHVRFTQGKEALACLSLTERGLLRWYAGCCKTPVGNTPRNFKMSHVGLVHTCLHDDPSNTLESSFGPVRMRLNTQHARGKPEPVNALPAIYRFASRLIRTRLDGSYKINPFFDADGAPVATPKVLSAAEREQALRAIAEA